MSESIYTMKHQYRLLPKQSKGFTLIELLISMTIGLFLLGGIGAIFLSTRQTNEVKNHIDNSIEAFRHGSFYIARYVRNAQTIRIGTSGSDPFVDLFPGPRSLDCLGNPILVTIPPTTIRIRHEAATGRLFCDSQVVLEQVSSIIFECLVASSTTVGSIVTESCDPSSTTATPSALRLTIATRRSPTSTQENVHSFVVAIRDELYKP